MCYYIFTGEFTFRSLYFDRYIFCISFTIFALKDRTDMLEDKFRNCIDS